MASAGNIDEFVDRSMELDQWRSVSSQARNGERPTVVLYHSRPANGLTRFLRECALHHSGDSLTFFVDGENQVANSVFSQILYGLRSRYPKLWKEWESHLESEQGHPRKARMAAKVPNLLPYVGTAISGLAEEAIEDRTIDISNYPSGLAELVCDFLSELSEDRSVLVFIDNVQALEPWSMDLLRTTGTEAYSNLVYVLGFVVRDDKSMAEDLKIRFESLGYDVLEIEFSPPGARFIRELADTLSVELDSPEATTIANRANGDIHHILSSVQQIDSFTDPPSEESFSALQETVLRFLHVAEQALRIDDIIELCSRSQEIFLEDSSEVYAALDELDHRSLVTKKDLPNQDHLVSLDSVSSPQLTALTTRPAENLTVARNLYKYFRERFEVNSAVHSEAELVPLLYRLSQKVESNMADDHAEEMVHLALETGSLNAARTFIESAIDLDEQAQPRRYFIKAAALLAVRDYENALELLDHKLPGRISDHKRARVLRAVSLNRCRYHWEADRLIEDLINDPKVSEEEKVILASYRISGRLHENDVSGAREVFETLQDDLEPAENYGHFLRNAASAFPPDRAVDLLSEARDLFGQEGDRFGEFTSLANLGGFRCELRDYEAAIEDLEVALEGLQPFGAHHLYIVENNMGLAYIHADRFQEAETHLQRAIRLARSHMSRAFVKVNLSILKWRQNREAEALGLLGSAEDEVENATFDRVCQKYYLSAAILKLLMGRGEREIRPLLSKAASHPDRMSPETTRRSVSAIQDHLAGRQSHTDQRLVSLLPTCRLSYWYQDPLTLVSDDTLSSDAGGEDVLD